jgi:hypothetical protein
MAITKTDDWSIGSTPEDLEQYLREFVDSEGHYPINTYRGVACPCGSIRFNVSRAGSITLRTCVSCKHTHYICRDAEDWEEAEAEEGSERYSCAECESEEANVGVGFAGYEEKELADAVKWFFVGVRCAECGILEWFNDAKVGRTPAAEAYDSI